MKITYLDPMLAKVELDKILFLDIETVPEEETYDELSEEKRELWAHKSAYQRKEEYTPEEYYHRAGIWAEFGKIVCISVGFFVNKGHEPTLRITSFFGEEEQLLRQFCDLLDNYFSSPAHLLCGHNAKEFDFPYLCRRMLILGMEIPPKLNLFGKKPWEIPHLDTMELWKFGDFKHYTSLKLLAHILGIPSPKGDIDGSMVRDVFYLEKDIDRIVKYCELDVLTTAQVFLRLRSHPLLEPHQVVYV